MGDVVWRFSVRERRCVSARYKDQATLAGGFGGGCYDDEPLDGGSVTNFKQEGFFGAVVASAVRVEIELAGGQRVAAFVGGDALNRGCRFYAAVVELKQGAPQAIVAYDAEGRELGRKKLEAV